MILLKLTVWVERSFKLRSIKTLNQDVKDGILKFQRYQVHNTDSRGRKTMVGGKGAFGLLGTRLRHPDMAREPNRKMALFSVMAKATI